MVAILGLVLVRATATVYAQSIEGLGPRQNDNSHGSNNIQGAGLCGTIGGCELISPDKPPFYFCSITNSSTSSPLPFLQKLDLLLPNIPHLY